MKKIRINETLFNTFVKKNDVDIKSEFNINKYLKYISKNLLHHETTINYDVFLHNLTHSYFGYMSVKDEKFNVIICDIIESYTVRMEKNICDNNPEILECFYNYYKINVHLLMKCDENNNKKIFDSMHNLFNKGLNRHFDKKYYDLLIGFMALYMHSSYNNEDVLTRYKDISNLHNLLIDNGDFKKYKNFNICLHELVFPVMDCYRNDSMVLKYVPYVIKCATTLKKQLLVNVLHKK